MFIKYINIKYNIDINITMDAYSIIYSAEKQMFDLPLTSECGLGCVLDVSLITMFFGITFTLFGYMIKPLFEKKENKIIYPYPIEDLPISLDERIKYYEEMSQHITTIDPIQPYIVRLDGRSFSRFTKKYKTNENVPYSIEFKKAMIQTCHDILHEFRPTTIYTHSDEITLIFKNAISDNGIIHKHLFGGRTFKIISLISSYASVRFNHNMNITKNSSEFVGSVNVNQNPTFDARIIVFPEEYEILNHMIWRSKGDCTRNFISMFAEKYISKKSIKHLKTNERT